VNLGTGGGAAVPPAGLHAGQLTLCGVNERFSPPVVMFLDPSPAGDQLPFLMVQVSSTAQTLKIKP
jgi:hypothetical protein